jgi:alkylation response protein AidB-like acyl-CoA dehydrogenase
VSAVVDRAQSVADDALFPVAQDVDRGLRPLDGGLRALADAGLFGIAGPASRGGADLDAATARRTIAAVGSGCGATFFVWVQHHGVVRTLRTSPNGALVDELLAPMCAGDVIAGVAFAHLRRPGPPAIRAERLGERGWRLDGFAPWATSWGIADWFAVAAASDDGEVVWVRVPGHDVTGLTARPLALPVFAHTGTVALDFDSFVADEAEILAVVDLDEWRRNDRSHAAPGQPAVLGVADRAIRLLEARADTESLDTAGRLRQQLEQRWRVDDEVVAAPDSIGEASAHRAACLDLAQRATTALLAASGGGGMDLAHPAQRLAREADFYVIQAQTADGRSATLRSI